MLLSHNTKYLTMANQETTQLEHNFKRNLNIPKNNVKCVAVRKALKT